ncbi:MAG: sulfatase [Planctomycetaceae bacterium]
MKRLLSFVCSLSVVVFAALAARAADRPNILWISCEDMSPNLGCYGDAHAVTPNLDRLASEGVKFTRAFTPAGVCAVVRSGVITGMYPVSIGSQHMRSRIIPPEEVRCFPELLRAAGYFCTNREKTDYQFEPPASAWDRQGKDHQDWRERRDPEQPFFSVINLTMTHESQIRHPSSAHDKVLAQIGNAAHDPNRVVDTLPAYLPNTPASRKDWAWYQDNITLMDKEAGDILKRLEDDGLTRSTIVVFWSDHGMGLPRGKRWIYDSGTHVPLIVRWPGNVDAASTREDLVSVLDLAPTMLSLAGVEVPKSMHGRVILGEQRSDEPDYLFFHRDRMDEVFETQRGARDRRWRYIRNYEPEKPYAQHLDYMDLMPTMIDWRAAAKAGTLTPPQSLWFASTKPIEELYDTQKDRWEVNNLADRPQYQERLQRMREATEAWQERMGDMGMIPEAVMMEEMIPKGERPTTQKVDIHLHDDRIELSCTSEGASIVYRTQAQGSDQWSDWLLYTKSIPAASIQQLEARANRLGWNDSEVIKWSDKP